MRTNLYVNGKRATKQDVIKLVGFSRLDQMISEAKETYADDPYIQIDYFIGGGKMLSISFT